jgi:hypothetical protein
LTGRQRYVCLRRFCCGYFETRDWHTQIVVTAILVLPVKGANSGNNTMSGRNTARYSKLICFLCVWRGRADGILWMPMGIKRIRQPNESRERDRDMEAERRANRKLLCQVQLFALPTIDSQITHLVLCADLQGWSDRKFKFLIEKNLSKSA